MFSCDAENLLLVKELPLYEGTRHTILSDVEEPGVFTDQIKWINTTEYNPERFSKLALSLLKAAEPQRVTAPDDRSPAIFRLNVGKRHD